MNNSWTLTASIESQPGTNQANLRGYSDIDLRKWVDSETAGNADLVVYNHTSTAIVRFSDLADAVKFRMLFDEALVFA